MKTYRLSFTIRQFLLGIALGIIGFSFVACAGAPPSKGTYFRATTAIGVSQSDGTADSDSLSGRGMAVGLRGEVAQPLDYLPGTEVGLRVGVTGRDAQAQPEGVDVAAESGELSAVAVLRGQEGLFYGEGFAGYAHNWGSVQGGPVDVSGDGGGLLYGAGAGLQFANGLQLGLEWSRRTFDIGEVELQADDIMLVIGGTLRF
jgi:hypothetical protein